MSAEQEVIEAVRNKIRRDLVTIELRETSLYHEHAELVEQKKRLKSELQHLDTFGKLPCTLR